MCTYLNHSPLLRVEFFRKWCSCHASRLGLAPVFEKLKAVGTVKVCAVKTVVVVSL